MDAASGSKAIISCSGLSRETRAAWRHTHTHSTFFLQRHSVISCQCCGVKSQATPTDQTLNRETASYSASDCASTHLLQPEKHLTGVNGMVGQDKVLTRHFTQAIDSLTTFHQFLKSGLLLYLIGSFSHELLGRHFPDGRNCDHPSHVVVVKVTTCLITQLLQEGNDFQIIWLRCHFIVTLRRRQAAAASYLECLLLEESKCVCKDIQSFHSLPIGCMEVGLNGQVLVAKESNWVSST